MKNQSFICGRTLGFVLASVFCLSFQVQTARASFTFTAAIDELAPGDQARVKNGEQVSVYQKSEIAEAPWPITQVYQWLPGVTPEEAAAVFADYELQNSYIPDLKKSKITRYEKNVAHVDYTVALPMGFGTEDYTAVDTLTGYDQGASYLFTWDVIPTKTIKVANGSARFEALETPAGKGTVFYYASFVYPDRWGTGLGWVIEAAKKRVRDTAMAIGNQMLKEKSGQPELLSKQMELLRVVLSTISSQDFVY